MYRIPKGTLLKLRKLAKDCASYDSGTCICIGSDCLIDTASETIICKYFRSSVLPSDPALNELVLRSAGESVKLFTKTCKECKTRFQSPSKNKALCDSCTDKNAKKRYRSYNRERTTK